MAERPSPSAARARPDTHERPATDDRDDNYAAATSAAAAAAGTRADLDQRRADQRDSDRRSARYIRRRHLAATVRTFFIVAGSAGFILGATAYIAGRAAGLGFPVPTVATSVPVAIALGLGLVAAAIFGVALRPRASRARDSNRGSQAPRGGTRWPGVDAAGDDGAARGQAVTR